MAVLRIRIGSQLALSGSVSGVLVRKEGRGRATSPCFPSLYLHSLYYFTVYNISQSIIFLCEILCHIRFCHHLCDIFLSSKLCHIRLRIMFSSRVSFLACSSYIMFWFRLVLSQSCLGLVLFLP